MGRVRPEPSECLGSGGLPMPRTEIRRDESLTGICAACLQRVPLDERGSFFSTRDQNLSEPLGYSVLAGRGLRPRLWGLLDSRTLLPAAEVLVRWAERPRDLV
jgi:hypothetical protein